MTNTDTSPLWQKQAPNNLSKPVQGLMHTRGLLTLALTAKCGAPLRVIPLFEGLSMSLPDEHAQVPTSEPCEGWVRSVLLTCKDSAMLYARSFIPFITQNDRSRFLQGQHTFSPIQSLGSKPLGLWLAEHPQLTRSTFKFAIHQANYWPHNPIVSNDRHPLRQSNFYQQQDQLILTEVFIDQAC